MVKSMSNIMFYKLFNNYYFSFNGNKYEGNTENMMFLRDNLSLPFSINFYNCSKEIINRVIKYLSTEDMTISVISSNGNNEITFLFSKSLFQEKLLRDRIGSVNNG